MRTLASIIIVSYNSRQHLERCLSSVAATIGPQCEVVLLDNASADGSADFVAERFPWVKLARSASNIGFAAGNNRAVGLAKGRYIVALNPDTEVTPGWLQALLRPMEERGAGTGRVGLTTARILMMDRREQVNTCGNNMHYTGLTVCRGLNREADAPELLRESEVSAVSGACFAISRALWDELGGFDGTFFTYLEDTDISMRARLLGYRCVYAPQAVVYHSYANNFSARKLYYLERNRPVMLLKCYTWRTLLAMLPALALAEAITWGYALKSGRQHVAARWKAYGWLLANRREIGRKRRMAQGCRRVSDARMLSATTARLDMAQLAGPALGSILNMALNPLFSLCYKLANAFARAATEGK